MKWLDRSDMIPTKMYSPNLPSAYLVIMVLRKMILILSTINVERKRNTKNHLKRQRKYSLSSMMSKEIEHDPILIKYQKGMC